MAGRGRAARAGGGSGSPRLRPIHVAPGVTAPPRQEQSPWPGAEGDDRLRALPPLNRPAPPAPRGGGKRGGEGGRGPPLPARLSTGADCTQCAPAAPRRRGGRAHAHGRQGSAATSVSHPTRLETRTKESDTRASRRASRTKPCGAMKVRAGAPRLRWDPAAGDGRRAHHRPVSPAPPGRWSMSARGRTRKMVNYAWAGRSQRKLWWRSAAVLTCKSVVRPGYRGERLIEPSSSWFPPKFPSG